MLCTLPFNFQQTIFSKLHWFDVVFVSFQAFEFYNRALRCLAERKKSPEVWDTVTWELSGSYFSMASLLQDYAPLSSYAQEQVKKETSNAVWRLLFVLHCHIF